MNKLNKNKGFSLIELLIAMTILSIIMIMVTQFMGTTSGALSKTKKNLKIQTKAMEIGTQLSDTLMQAKYIRVATQDGRVYELDTTLGPKKKNRTVSDVGDVNGDLVVDNYPNWNNGTSDERTIIYNPNTYKLVDKNGNAYPLSSDPDTIGVVSFRRLKNELPSGNYQQLYVKPMFIYVVYQAKKEDGTLYDAFAIYQINGNSLYVGRGDMPAVVSGDGYANAFSSLSGTEGLITDDLVDFYLSADSDGNALFIDFVLQDGRYKQYNYNYVETVQFRNSEVLTVRPQKLNKYTK